MTTDSLFLFFRSQLQCCNKIHQCVYFPRYVITSVAPETVTSGYTGRGGRCGEYREKGITLWRVSKASRLELEKMDERLKSTWKNNREKLVGLVLASKLRRSFESTLWREGMSNSVLEANRLAVWRRPSLRCLGGRRRVLTVQMTGPMVT